MELDESHGKIPNVSHQRMSRITNRTLLQSENMYVAAIATVKMTNKGQGKRNYETKNIMQPFLLLLLFVLILWILGDMIRSDI